MYQPTIERIEKAIQLADTTREILIGENLLDQCGNTFRKMFGPEKSAVLIADENTMQAAGTELRRILREENSLKLEDPFVFTDPKLHSEMGYCEQLRSFLANTEAIPIAVGSGTINDLVKLAAYETGRPYMVLATAASMDGYTAYGAPVEVGGFKKTIYCDAPTAVIVDMNIIRSAPQRLAAAGYADLIAKIPAGADWMLADLVGSEPIIHEVWPLVQGPIRTWVQDPRGVAKNDKSALLNLMDGLLTSGIAMQRAKTSRTASGAEHLFSHLWDNEQHTFEGEIPFHGFKVGIGSISTEALYEQVLLLEKEDFLRQKPTLLEKRRSWEQTERLIRDSFSHEELIERVVEESRTKFVDDQELLRRLDVIAESWDSLREELKAQLFGAEKIQQFIRESGAPFEPEQIGIDRKRLRLSYDLAQLIRSRYNILDFVHETGMKERCIAPIFERGIWKS